MVGEVLTLLLGVTGEDDGQVIAVWRPLHRNLSITTGNDSYLLDIGERDGLDTAIGLNVEDHHSGGLAVILRDNISEVGANRRPRIFGNGGNTEAGLGHHLHLG